MKFVASRVREYDQPTRLALLRGLQFGLTSQFLYYKKLGAYKVRFSGSCGIIYGFCLAETENFRRRLSPESNGKIQPRSRAKKKTRTRTAIPKPMKLSRLRRGGSRECDYSAHATRSEQNQRSIRATSARTRTVPTEDVLDQFLAEPPGQWARVQ